MEDKVLKHTTDFFKQRCFVPQTTQKKQRFVFIMIYFVILFSTISQNHFEIQQTESSSSVPVIHTVIFQNKGFPEFLIFKLILLHRWREAWSHSSHRPSSSSSHLRDRKVPVSILEVVAAVLLSHLIS